MIVQMIVQMKNLGLVALVTLTLTACGDDGYEHGMTPGGGSGDTCPDPQGSRYMSSCSSDSDCGPVMSCVRTCPSCSKSCKLLCGEQSDCDAAGAGSCYGSSCTLCRKWCHGAPTINPNCGGAGSDGDGSDGDGSDGDGSDGDGSDGDGSDGDGGYKSTCPEWLSGCSKANGCTSCDTSCGSHCQNLNGTTCGPKDCMDCAAGYTLQKIYSDGTGRCVADSVCTEREVTCVGSGAGASLKWCTNNSWTTKSCATLCKDAGYDAATSCSYASDKGEDVCYCSQKKGIGDPCSSSSECASGMCLGGGWCSKTCSSHSDCNGDYSGGTNSNGNENSCLDDTAGGKHCFPDCNTNADCGSYASGTSCKAVSSDGWNVCSF
jgi:hypothetical protein